MSFDLRKFLKKGLVAFCVAAAPAVSMAAPVSQTDFGRDFGSGKPLVNVRVNPLNAMQGLLAAEVDISLSDRITLGPTLGYRIANVVDTRYTGYSAGIRGNFHVTGHTFSDGWFVGPFMSYDPLSIVSTLGRDQATGSTSGLTFGTYLGYQWFWRDRFNLNLAIGGQYMTLDSTASVATRMGKNVIVDMPSFSGLNPVFEFSLGYAL